LTVSNSSFFTPALLRTHSFVFFAVHETRRIFLSPFISKASRRASSFFLRVQLSQPYVATGHTSAFISRIFVEIGILWLFHIFCSNAPIACPLFNLVRNSVVHSPSSVIRDPRYGNVFTDENNTCESTGENDTKSPLAITCSGGNEWPGLQCGLPLLYLHKRRVRRHSRWKLSQELKGKIILATFFAKYTCGNGQS